MAWRDASISHIKNGIYGEMFVAAMLACAAVTDDIYDIINGGLAQIPSTSRLYQEISFVLQQHKNGTACEACFADIHAKYNEYSEHDWCHTIFQCHDRCRSAALRKRRLRKIRLPCSSNRL